MTSHPATSRVWNRLAEWPRVRLAYLPTPLERLPNLSAHYPGGRLWMKRDDCTGLAMGGNKARQLEFYLGDALAQGCDTVVSTGAIQSNYMRSLAAAAAQLGLECHLQLESRVVHPPHEYGHSGNVLLDHLFGARIHLRDEGDDELGADRAIQDMADTLRAQGKKPYIVPLAPVKKPIGALGYVAAAAELIPQFEKAQIVPDLLVVGSGSGLTHAGLLVGLRLMDLSLPVLGACVRREADLQRDRVLAHCRRLEDMLGVSVGLTSGDIRVSDIALAPGYGQASDAVMQAVVEMARTEGILVDPVYSAKTVATTLAWVRRSEPDDRQHVVMFHTGGTPALFAYRERIQSAAAFGL